MADPRALDVAVAEKVFGFTDIQSGLDGYRWGKRDGEQRVIPRYSVGWAGAGLVVDEMRRRGWQCQITTMDETVMVWFIRWADFPGDPDAKSGPELCDPCIGVAVARAALAALEAA